MTKSKIIKKVFLLMAVAVLLVSCRSNSGEKEENNFPDYPDYPEVPELGGIGNGWNLGNSLDSNRKGVNTDNMGLSEETSWGLPFTTKQMIDAVKEKGFKTIRIPVSWHNHISNRNGYKIDAEWMARVKQIVDWSLEDGLYVILNIHHDNLTEAEMNKNSGFCVSSNSELQNRSKDYIMCVWTQISETFKDYGGGLIFEVLNEPRCIGTAYEWSTGAYLNEVKAANKIIMSYEKAALDAIRGAGFKNSDRLVMVPPYAASPYMMDGWSMPGDSASGKLILSVHAYTPYEFAMNTDSVKIFTDSHKRAIDDLFNVLEKNYTAKGIRVIIGETSASDKNNTSERVKWAEYYCGKAGALGISCILWDNMVTFADGVEDAGERHGYLNRNDCSWYFPQIVNEFVK